MRMGALLNFRAAPNATVELTRVSLQTKPPFTLYLLVIPEPMSLYTPNSQAAYLSRHWSPQYIANDNVGANELWAIARSKIRPRPQP